MTKQNKWSREQLLIAFWLYAQLPFGQLHSRNSEIIKYAKLIGRTSGALAMKLTNLASLDPEITSSGRSGLSGASAADRTMWVEMQSDWTAFAAETEKALSALGAKPLEEAETLDADYTAKTKATLIQARVGQGFFRNSVMSAYNFTCCVSGLAVPRLLVASHIVPWRSDEKNRLNPMNGLCLSAIHDKAFDSGIITVDGKLRVTVSPKFLKQPGSFFKAAILAYDGKPITLPEKFPPSMAFLEYHRKHIFLR